MLMWEYLHKNGEGRLKLFSFGHTGTKALGFLLKAIGIGMFVCLIIKPSVNKCVCVCV